MLKKIFPLIASAVLLCQLLHGQYLMDMVDTTKDMGKGMLAQAVETALAHNLGLGAVESSRV